MNGIGSGPADRFDPALLERLLRAQVAALSDPAAVAEGGIEKLAFAACERAGLLRRVGTVPADLEAVLAEERTLGAALAFMEGLALEDRLAAIIARGREEPAVGEEPLEAPGHADEVETFFLDRDGVQAALGEVARRLPRGRRAALARVVARLARLDERFRAHAHEFFAAVPMIRSQKQRFDWQALPAATWWWWREIDGALEQLAAGLPPLGALEREGRAEDRCAGDFDDIGYTRAAFAGGERFPDEARFREHLLGCRACREAVDALRTAASTPAVLRLAAAGDAAAEAEPLRALVFAPKTRIPGTAYFVSRSLKDARLRFTFHEEGGAGRTRALDGSRLAIEGVGEAVVEDGAAEIALPAGPREEAARAAVAARRTLALRDGTLHELP